MKHECERCNIVSKCVKPFGEKGSDGIVHWDLLCCHCTKARQMGGTMHPPDRDPGFTVIDDIEGENE